MIDDWKWIIVFLILCGGLYYIHTLKSELESTKSELESTKSELNATKTLFNLSSLMRIIDTIRMENINPESGELKPGIQADIDKIEKFIGEFLLSDEYKNALNILTPEKMNKGIDEFTSLNISGLLMNK